MSVARILLLSAILQFSLAEDRDEKIYCGAKNCYDVLGLSENVKLSDIKKTYKKLSMEWHPDKNLKPGAKDKFAEIAHAYGILSDEDQRRDYDYALKHPEERTFNQARYYYRQYYSKNVKVNPVIVIIGFLLAYSAIQYFSMKYAHESALNKFKESPKYKMALKALKQEKLEELEREKGATNNRSKSGKKISKKELDAIEVDESVLLERVQVHGSYAKPVLTDLVIVSIFLWPYHLVRGIIWQYQWYMKYSIRKEEYTDEAKEFLTRSVIGMSTRHWEGLEPKMKADWMSKELWVPEHEKKWRETQRGVWE